MLIVPLDSLGSLLRGLEPAGLTLEHVFDYYARVMWRIALRTALLVMCALLVTLTLAVLSARHREHEDRTAHHPGGGILVSAYATRVFVQRSGDPALPAVVFIAGTAG